MGTADIHGMHGGQAARSPAAAEEVPPRRLSWVGRQGIAQCDGVQVPLRKCPWPMPIVEIEYAPAVHVAEIRESAQSWRPMTKAERDAADDQLTRCAAAARGVL